LGTFGGICVRPLPVLLLPAQSEGQKVMTTQHDGVRMTVVNM